MTSTASQRLRLDKQATGDNPDAWGDRLNGVIDLVDEAFGFAEIAVNGDVTLSAQNFVSDQARRGVLRFTGSGGFNVVIPAVEKLYLIDNRCAGPVVIKTASTLGSTLGSGDFRLVYCDGATVNAPSPTGSTALSTPFTPTGGVSATNVQAAIAELDAEKYAKTGGNITGDLGLTRAAGTERGINFSTDGKLRFRFVGASSTGETGSNTGSNMAINRYDDAGNFLSTLFDVNRRTGNANFEKLSVAGRPTYGAQVVGGSADGGAPTLVGTEREYLNIDFVATGEQIFATARGNVNNAGPAVNVVWSFYMLDLSSGGATSVADIFTSSAAATFGATAIASMGFFAATTPGRSYRMSLRAYKGSDNGAAVSPNQFRVQAINA